MDDIAEVVVIKRPMTFPMYFTSLGAFLGGPFIYGYNIGCLNIPAAHVKDFIRASIKAHYGIIDDEKNTFTTAFFSIIVLLFAAGGALGAFFSGKLADKVGRKRAVLLTLILTLIGSFCCTIAEMSNAVEVMMLGRLLIGIGAGACFSCVPLYVVEIVPQHVRGATGASSQLFITIGIFVGSALTLESVFGSEMWWPVGVGAQSLFCMISAVMLLSPIAQESPRWLLVFQRDHESAKEGLCKLYVTKDVRQLMDELRRESDNSGEGKTKTGGLMMFLKSHKYRIPILLVIALNACQQLSGVNVVFFYAGSLYAKAGLVGKEISYAVLVISTISVLSTIVCVLLMDRLGRRKLLLPPMFVLCLSIIAQVMLLLMSKSQPDNKMLAWGIIGTVIIFIICFTAGLAPIPTFVASELFTDEYRATAQAIGGTTNLVSTLAVALLFENVLFRFLEEYSFLPFLVITALGLVFFVFKLPETKDRTVTEIYRDKHLTSCSAC